MSRMSALTVTFVYTPFSRVADFPLPFDALQAWRYLARAIVYIKMFPFPHLIETGTKGVMLPTSLLSCTFMEGLAR